MSEKTITMKIDKDGCLHIRRGPNLKKVHCNKMLSENVINRYCVDDCARFKEDEDDDIFFKRIECCGTIHKCLLDDFIDERVKEDK